MIKAGCCLLLLLFVYGCTHPGSGKSKTKTQPVPRDLSITKAISYSDMFLDSLAVEKFITEQGLIDETANQLRNFYNSRNYQYAWFTEKGLEQQARSFWNLHNNYLRYTQDSSLYSRQLHYEMDSLLSDESEVPIQSSRFTQLELELTLHFFNYAQVAFEGRIDPGELQWHIPRKKINALGLLDSLIQRNGEMLDTWEPLNAQYKKVRMELLRLYELQKRGGWPQVEARAGGYRPGDTALGVVQLKNRFRLAGDFLSDDTSLVFTDELEKAVRRFQKRFGLESDGIAGPATLRVMNIPLGKRIEQVLVNMERMRWMPPRPKGKLLLANIPEFRLHVFEGDREMFRMKIVVGREANRTVVFNDQLKYVVFSPYWNIPRSIVRNEIVPAMTKNRGYLARNNMEQTGFSGGLPVIRQKPGGANALGRVKFIFPNNYNIYFHDTPAQALFDHPRRAFSHGCIRLEQPEKLAAYLLQGTGKWTDEAINTAMYAGTEKWVSLENPVSVLITYFTAWVDEEGILNFREDIYGHDKALADRLFTE